MTKLLSGTQRITQQHEWIKTLSNPLVEGIKIPDPFTFMLTGTVQIQHDFNFKANAQGVFGYQIDPVSSKYIRTADDAVEGVITWNGAFVPIAEAGLNFLNNITAQRRVVSACIDVYYTGATQTDGGQLYGYNATNYQIGSHAAGGTLGNRNVPADIQAVANYPGTFQYPVRNSMRVLWYPTGTVTATAFIGTPSDPQVMNHSFCPFIGFILIGAAENSPISVKATLNYEYQSLSDDINLNLGPSPIHNDSWNKALNWISDVSNKVVPLFGGWNQVVNSAAQLVGSKMLNTNVSRFPRLTY